MIAQSESEYFFTESLVPLSEFPVHVLFSILCFVIFRQLPTARCGLSLIIEHRVFKKCYRLLPSINFEFELLALG
jgi:hypothetical protein